MVSGNQKLEPFEWALSFEPISEHENDKIWTKKNTKINLYVLLQGKMEIKRCKYVHEKGRYVTKTSS